MSDAHSFERIGQIFDEARSLSEDQRSAFLERACAGDATLRGEVEGLLREHDRASPLDVNTPGQAVGTLAQQLAALTPEVIGPYRIIESIGEGGMGAVYLARQADPAREVAIKVVKPGMDSRQVLARFEAERQALALMEHPNIAMVFDAGMSELGHPYFAMELVKGQPITAYCDDASMPVPERLELFVKVCHAIQHAHQKGVIHRDIKPSNVLVTLVDGRPEPKVIDFGVAKSIETDPGAETLLTRHGQAIGTPAYMAPEQASLGARGVDTRTDVYALGVLLYELLTGSTPFLPAQLEQAGHQEMLRTLQERDPARPSVRLSSLGAGSIDIAKRRGSAPQTLGSLLRGDLDWIVMKCLEKDPARRYQAAMALSEDIARLQRCEPIEARPPTTGYKLRKFVRRNRGRVIAGGVVASALLLGLAGTSVGLVWALDERSKADAAAKAELAAQIEATAAAERAALEAYAAEELSRFFIMDVLSSADPARASGPDLTVREALTNASSSLEGKFEDRPDVEARIHNALGYLFQSLGSPELAEHHHLRQWEITREFGGEASLESAAMLHSVVGSLAGQGRDDEAIELTKQQLEIIDQLEGPEARQLRSRAIGNLGALLVRTGRHAEAAPMLEQTLEYKRAAFGDSHPTTLSTINNLSMVKRLLGDGDASYELAQEAYSGRARVLGESDPRTITSLTLLARSLEHLGRDDEAIEIASGGYETALERLGPAHPATLNVGNLTAQALLRSGDTERAAEIAHTLVSHFPTDLQNARGEDHASLLATLATIELRRNRTDDALVHATRALEMASERYAEDDSRLSAYLRVQGEVMGKLGREAEAVDLFARAWSSAIERDRSAKAALARLIVEQPGFGRSPEYERVLRDAEQWLETYPGE